MTVRLLATDGELTVVRRLAAIAYGTWNVEWPESVPEQQRPQLADDRTHGYISRLPGDSGRMGRRFVRADVDITAAEYNDKGVLIPHTGYSTVETVLDAAASQTSEDAVLERDITRDGLGSFVPGEDFDVGDVVDVVIWGNSLRLPVTAIEAVTQAGAVIDWSVKVGGQLVADDAERRRVNQELERTIWQERREIAGVHRVATSAKTTADSASATAKEAIDAVGDVAAMVEGLDIEGSIQQARDAVDASNAILQLVRQLTGAAAAQGAQAQASASLAIEYARQAEEVLDKLDPLRDDVVAAHAEVARLSGAVSYTHLTLPTKA